jgi:hypothetical protein
VFTCPSCKKNFENPLKTLNLQQNPTEPYLACPYCLTKIEEQSIPKVNEAQEAAETKAIPVPVSQAQTKEEQKTEKVAKPATCQYHLGYLSERSGKGIPDNCLTCKSIVDCMLRKMRQ